MQHSQGRVLKRISRDLDYQDIFQSRAKSLLSVQKVQQGIMVLCLDNYNDPSLSAN